MPTGRDVDPRSERKIDKSLTAIAGHYSHRPDVGPMPVETDADVIDILKATTIAVVGCSTTPGKDAHEVPAYLQEQGYKIIPVNPNASSVLGRGAYDSLSAIEEDIEIVNVFRPSDEVAGIVDEVIERGDVDVIWLQLGIHDDVAMARAEAAGIRLVQDRCMRSEHTRLVGAK